MKRYSPYIKYQGVYGKLVQKKTGRYEFNYYYFNKHVRNNHVYLYSWKVEYIEMDKAEEITEEEYIIETVMDS